MAARKRRSSRQKVSLSISLRMACRPLKACRRANSQHAVYVRFWHKADIPRLTMSAFGGKADIGWRCHDVCFCPKADIGQLPVTRALSLPFPWIRREPFFQQVLARRNLYSTNRLALDIPDSPPTHCGEGNEPTLQSRRRTSQNATSKNGSAKAPQFT